MNFKKVYILIGALLICTFGLCACAPKYDDIKNKYKDDGYRVSEIPTSSDTAKDLAASYEFNLDKVEGMFRAIKNGVSINSINVYGISFSDGKEATALYNTLYNKQKENDNESFEVIKKGNTVIYGTSEAVHFIK